LSIIRDRILADPAKHSDFVARYKWFVKEFGEPLVKALKARLVAGEEMPGWKLTRDVQYKYLEPADIIPVICRARPEQVFYAAGGEISVDKFLELAASVGVEDAEKLVKSAPGTPQMRQVKKKKDN
jgi:hypothetical protein